MMIASKPAHRLLSPLLLVASLSLTANAYAVTIYTETALGLTQYRTASPYFGNAVTNPTDFGYAFNLGSFVSFADGRDAFDFQLGFQGRYNTASDAAGSYTLLGVYPVLRIQLSRAYIAGAYTPFLWSNGGPAAGTGSLGRDLNATALYFEAGALFPITPKFSLGLAGTVAYVNNSGTLSPGPVTDGLFFMRFYAAPMGGSGGEATSNEFRGWRYPFGRIR